MPENIIDFTEADIIAAQTKLQREYCTHLLTDVTVCEQLTDILLRYKNDFCDLLILATVENGGVRPAGVINEIYSCFHHISRGLLVQDDDISLEKELESAWRHLRRATLDCYKIALRSFLEENVSLRETLNYLNIVEDFEKYVPDGLKLVTEINDISKRVHSCFMDAKRYESNGKFSEAIDKCNETLELAYELREKIQKITKNNSLLTKICGWFFSKMKLTAFVSNTYNCFCGRESEVQI